MKNKACICGEPLEYFNSIKEHKVFADLKIRQRIGEIEALEPHPKFPLIVNGVKVGTYTADAAYKEKGVIKVVDAKGGKSQRGAAASDSRLRMRIAEAIYGFTVEIV